MEQSEITPFRIIEGQSQKNTIIELTEARRRYDQEHCQHNHVVVDAQLYQVECGDCGRLLNPIALLVRMARDETRLAHRSEQVRGQLEQLAKRSRTLCQHCGKITAISGW